MSIKKYRLYLMMVVFIAVIAGALLFLYSSEQKGSYADGLLVKNEFVADGEELV